MAAPVGAISNFTPITAPTGSELLPAVYAGTAANYNITGNVFRTWLLASSALTGTPTAPTAVVTDTSTTIATTAFVKSTAMATGGTVSQTLVKSSSTNYATQWIESPAASLNAWATGASGTTGYNAAPDLTSAIAARNGGEIKIGIGQYRLDSGVTSSAPIVLTGHSHGEGPGTTSNTQVSQIYSNFTAGDLIAVTSPYGSRFEHINFAYGGSTRTSGAGLHLIGANQVASVNYNTSGDYVGDCSFTNQYVGLQITNGTNNRVENCYFQAWSNSALMLDDADHIEDVGGNIAFCRFYGDTTVGTAQTYSFVSHHGYFKLRDCYFVGSKQQATILIDSENSGAPEIVGSQFEDFDVSAIIVSNANNYNCAMLSICDNETYILAVRTNSQSHINIVQGAGGWLSRVKINNNRLNGYTTSGNAFINVRTGSHVEICGNMIDGAGTGGVGNGIYVGGDATDVLVSGNTIKNIGGTPYVLTTACTLIDLMSGLTVAQAPTCKNGSLVYFTDANPASTTLTGGSTGAIAVMSNGAWVPVTVSNSAQLTGAAQKASNLSDLASASSARTNLGLGTAATYNQGTSGATLPTLSGSNTWSSAQTLTSASALQINNSGDAAVGAYIGTTGIIGGAPTSALRIRGDSGISLGTGGTLGIAIDTSNNTSFTGTVSPTADNTKSLGQASFRWSQLYAGTATINTSDGTEKAGFRPAIEAELLAALDIEYVFFQWNDAIAAKGSDKARWHYGPVAQQVRDAFAKRGVDASRLALFCEDTAPDGGAIIGLRLDHVDRLISEARWRVLTGKLTYISPASAPPVSQAKSG